MTTALIIDDSKRDRDDLMELLRKHEDIDIVQQCESGIDGLKAIAKHRPQLIFLDVEMPVMDGFQMLEEIKDRNFEVIFTTAHNEYGIKALNLVSLHYLLKPVQANELEEALDKLRNKENEQNKNQINTLLENNKEGQGKKNKIVIPSKKDLKFFNILDIVYCKSDKDYTDFYFKGNLQSNFIKNLYRRDR